MSNSRIFAGYRALGFTCNHVPFSIRYHQKHKENYVVTAVGKAFHTYNCTKLGITSISDSHPSDITCLSVDSFLVFTACANEIRAFQHNRQVLHTYDGHQHPVHLLLPYGKHLISVDEASCLKIWDIASEELYLEIEFPNASFEISAILHPSTYLNKVLLGSKQGAMQLWNIHSNKLIYTFNGWGGSAVTVLEQAPAVDVVAVGLASGKIVVHNLKYDETLMTFTQDWGPVTSMAFRTDGQPILATGSALGHIALWNLEEKKLQSQMRDCHQGSVTSMRCLPSEPLLMTSSSDNSLKVWIFDLPDGGGRLLRMRSGHSAPPNKVRFHGKDGLNVLSAGQDSTLRSFSTDHDSKNKNLGRASYNKAKSKKTGLIKDQHKMPAITDFGSESSRQSDWDSIAACHHGESQVTLWNYVKGSMGQHKLRHADLKNARLHANTAAMCLDVSSCGNFVAIGYSSGHVHMFNMQSGLYRGAYGEGDTELITSKTPAHSGSIRGIAIDSLNQVVVTAGADSCINFWRFKTGELLETTILPSQIARMLLHRESSMLAVALDDFKICVIDMETRKIVRRFNGHSSSINDMTFSPDARWLISATMDAKVYTWDLPSGSLIDCFVVDQAITSLSLSPTGTYLATSHVDDLGVYLWSNKTLYSHVSLRPLPAEYEPQMLDMPATAIDKRLRDDVNLPEGEEDVDCSTFQSPEQISSQLVTLSLLPESRWKSLILLDVIKMRNKPKQPPKAPKAAPFFLPTVAGVVPKFDTSGLEEDDKMTKPRVSLADLTNLSAFGQRLQAAQNDVDFSTVMKTLRELGPSGIDTELRSLSPEGGGSIEVMVQFMRCISFALKTNRDFELAQAYLALFLKIHGNAISEDEDLREELQELQETQGSAWLDLEQSIQQSLCLVNYLRSAVI